MDIDIHKLHTRFAEIREHLDNIRRIAEQSDAEIFADSRNMAALKYHLIVILEAMGSLCVHVCVKKLNTAVNEYADCFDHLRKGGIVSEELGVELIKMARFRNLIVHRYWEAEDQRILTYVRTELNVIEEFMKQIAERIAPA